MKPSALVISYARRDNTLRLVEQLILVGIEKIYVSVDGPRNRNVSELQVQLNSELKRLKDNFSGEILIWQRKLNLGSGASVIASLDWVFKCEESCVILEDDLIVTNDFFSFVNYGLRIMKNQKNLKIVTGTNPFDDVTLGRLGKINYPVSWGWATNRDNWAKIRDLIFNGAPSKSAMSGSRRRQYWKVGRKRALLGQIEAWDVPLASEMYKTDYYTLIPPTNLVCNIGFDQYAAHTSESVWPLNLKIGNLSEESLGDYDESLLIDLNDEFEKKIFMIRRRHKYTWIVNSALDNFRYRKTTMPLSERIKIEKFPVQ